MNDNFTRMTDEALARLAAESQARADVLQKSARAEQRMADRARKEIKRRSRQGRIA